MFSMAPEDPLSQLRHALSLPPGDSKISRTVLAAVLREAEIGRRLRAYAAHKEDCGHHTQGRPYSGVILPGKCSCGLDDVKEGRFPGEERRPGEADGWGARQRR